MDIGTYARNIKKINVKDIAIKTVKEVDVFFIDANIDQLRHGKRSGGGMIGKYASQEYAAMKYAENSLAGLGNIDLILTGKFKDGIYIQYKADGLLFDSKGKEKEGGFDILEHFGDDVLGVSDESKEQIAPDFQEAFIVRFFNELNKL